MMLLVWWWWEKWVGTEVGPLFVTSLALCCSGGLRCDPLVSLVVQSGWGWAAWPYMGIISWWTDQSGGGWLGIEVFSSWIYAHAHVCWVQSPKWALCSVLCWAGSKPVLVPSRSQHHGCIFSIFSSDNNFNFLVEKMFFQNTPHSIF